MEQQNFESGEFKRKEIKEMFREVIREELKQFNKASDAPYDINDIADYLKVSVKAVRIYISEHQMPAHRVNNKKLYFYRKEIDEWLKNFRLQSAADLQEQVANSYKKL